MTINISHIKEADLLVDATIKLSLDWVKLETFKAFLKKNEKSLGDISTMQKYLEHLQKDLFIFDCAYTYLTVYENTLFILSKSKHSLTYRMDRLGLVNQSEEWQSMNIPTNMLLRIRNAIDIIANPTEEDMCVELLSTISSDILV